jgi:acyl-CoA thioesterase-1
MFMQIFRKPFSSSLYALVVAAGAFIGPQWDARAATQNGPAILVWGDSLSAGYGIDVNAGWVALLGRRLTAEGYGYPVVNASVSGETSGGGRDRLPHALGLHKPAIVLIELGANDALRGLPIASIRENLTAMIQAAGAHGARVVLIGMMMPPNYGDTYTSQFQDMYADLARRFKLPLVPFLLDGIALDPNAMQADGLHPVAAAQPRVLANVWPVLEPLLGNKAVEKKK